MAVVSASVNPGHAADGSLRIEVRCRPITGRRDADHLVGMQWGSYFFPGGFYWQTAQAVPLVGFYDTHNRDVIRQQALWLMDMGIDFLVADWPVYIPPDAEGKQRWRNRNEFGMGQIHATTMMLEGLAQLRDEGYPAPAMVIMAYLLNGPANSTETVNEELEWLYDNFVRNPRFHDLWVVHEGKPLVMLLYCAGTPADQLSGPPIGTTHFTVRYVGTQLQRSHMERYGYWSWMDGSAEPVVTFVDGKAEAVTPTPRVFRPREGLAGRGRVRPQKRHDVSPLVQARTRAPPTIHGVPPVERVHGPSRRTPLRKRHLRGQLQRRVVRRHRAGVAHRVGIPRRLGRVGFLVCQYCAGAG